MAQPEKIQPDEVVSRWIFHPHKINEYGSLLWENIFQFQRKHGRTESLVWHKYAPGLACVHRRGCAEQKPEGKTYRGAITALAGKITSYRNQNGHGLIVEHAPQEGRWHAEVRYDLDSRKEFTGQDKVDLIEHLRGVFSEFSEHSCSRGGRIGRLALTCLCDILCLLAPCRGKSSVPLARGLGR